MIVGVAKTPEKNEKTLPPSAFTYPPPFRPNLSIASGAKSPAEIAKKKWDKLEAKLKKASLRIKALVNFIFFLENAN